MVYFSIAMSLHITLRYIFSTFSKFSCLKRKSLKVVARVRIFFPFFSLPLFGTIIYFKAQVRGGVKLESTKQTLHGSLFCVFFEFEF